MANTIKSGTSTLNFINPGQMINTAVDAWTANRRMKQQEELFNRQQANSDAQFNRQFDYKVGQDNIQNAYNDRTMGLHETTALSNFMKQNNIQNWDALQGTSFYDIVKKNGLDRMMTPADLQVKNANDIATKAEEILRTSGPDARRAYLAYMQNLSGANIIGAFKGGSYEMDQRDEALGYEKQRIQQETNRATRENAALKKYGRQTEATDLLEKSGVTGIEFDEYGNPVQKINRARYKAATQPTQNFDLTGGGVPTYQEQMYPSVPPTLPKPDSDTVGETTITSPPPMRPYGAQISPMQYTNLGETPPEYTKPQLDRALIDSGYATTAFNQGTKLRSLDQVDNRLQASYDKFMAKPESLSVSEKHVMDALKNIGTPGSYFTATPESALSLIKSYDQMLINRRETPVSKMGPTTALDFFSAGSMVDRGIWVEAVNGFFADPTNLNRASTKPQPAPAFHPPVVSQVPKMAGVSAGVGGWFAPTSASKQMILPPATTSTTTSIDPAIALRSKAYDAEAANILAQLQLEEYDNMTSSR